MNLVANCIPSVPVTHIAVDTPQRPRRSEAREDIRALCLLQAASSQVSPRPWLRVSRALLYTAIQQPPLSAPPLPRSSEPIMPLPMSRPNSALSRAGIRNPDPVSTAN